MKERTPAKAFLDGLPKTEKRIKMEMNKPRKAG